MGTVEKRDRHKKSRYVSPKKKLEREIKDCMHCRFFWGITTDVPTEHVVNYPRKRNRSFHQNVLVALIIKEMAIVFLVCVS